MNKQISTIESGIPKIQLNISKINKTYNSNGLLHYEYKIKLQMHNKCRIKYQISRLSSNS